MSIEWDKTQKTESEENTDTTPEYIANMQNAMDEICQMLSEESRNFKPPKFLLRCIAIFQIMIDYYIPI